MVSLLFLVIYLTLPLFLLFFFQNYRIFKKSSLPPGPRGLPIIGNLHQLDNSISHHLQLWQLSKKYGPLFSLQLGLKPAIVISSPQVAKEVLKNHDLEFSGRPNLLGQQKLSYNGLDMAFCPYGEYWREIRKICVVHVFSSIRISRFSSIRQFEVKQLIKKISIHASSSKVTNLNEMLMTLVSTIICRIAFGKRYDDEGTERSRFHELLNESQAMMATLFVSDFIPFLGWIDKFRGLHARLERNFKELDKFYQQVIDEHMGPNRKIEQEDIIDVLLQLKKQRCFSTDLTFDHIKAVFMNMLVVATDTSSASTIWAMTALIKNPRVMKKVQDEIRNLGEGKKDFLYEDVIQKFPYFKAVIKETLRLYSPVPVVPRATNEKCIINGYEIPDKTIVYVNDWAIHRDPEAWEDPEEFLPERFLDNNIDFLGQDFKLIPLELILVNLLYLFDLELPRGIEKEDIDTEALPGICPTKEESAVL